MRTFDQYTFEYSNDATSYRRFEHGANLHTYVMKRCLMQYCCHCGATVKHLLIFHNLLFSTSSSGAIHHICIRTKENKRRWNVRRSRQIFVTEKKYFNLLTMCLHPFQIKKNMATRMVGQNFVVVCAFQKQIYLRPLAHI